MSYLMGSRQYKIFAATCADQIHRDRNVLVIDIEDVYFCSGHSHRHHALRHLENKFRESRRKFIAGFTANVTAILFLSQCSNSCCCLRTARKARIAEILIVTTLEAAYAHMKVEMERRLSIEEAQGVAY